MSDVLVLDSTGLPIYIAPMKDAVRLWTKDKAVVLEEDFEGKLLHSDSFEMGMPRVVQLRNWCARKLDLKVPFSRRNLIIRDSIMRNGKPTLVCQYCADALSLASYSLDHIVPRSHGGLSTWANLVACCKDCNSRKSNLTLQQSGMRLMRQPIEPSIHDPKFTFRLQIKNPRAEWWNYLYWNVELEK